MSVCSHSSFSFFSFLSGSCLILDFWRRFQWRRQQQSTELGHIWSHHPSTDSLRCCCAESTAKNWADVDVLSQRWKRSESLHDVNRRLQKEEKSNKSIDDVNDVSKRWQNTIKDSRNVLLCRWRNPISKDLLLLFSPFRSVQLKSVENVN